MHVVADLWFGSAIRIDDWDEANGKQSQAHQRVSSRNRRSEKSAHVAAHHSTEHVEYEDQQDDIEFCEQCVVFTFGFLLERLHEAECVRHVPIRALANCTL